MREQWLNGTRPWLPGSIDAARGFDRGKSLCRRSDPGIFRVRIYSYCVTDHGILRTSLGPESRKRRTAASSELIDRARLFIRTLPACLPAAPPYRFRSISPLLSPSRAEPDLLSRRLRLGIKFFQLAIEGGKLGAEDEDRVYYG